jgi:transcriptional regulator with XRE-family HTH domain
MAKKAPPAPETLAAHVKRRVKELRKEQGLTQEELCEAAGLSLDAVTRIERGTREPTLGTLAKLAVALRVEPATLLSGAAAAPPQLAAPVAKIATLLSARPSRVQKGAERIITAFLRSLDDA